ncbi:filamentous hemagglutinin N-terminal domain-containing protein [Marinicellulosiphila megalodicopiae]|uniref:filamentous hemagglutinin N-terminal domain-containing protein n=1 Tax=Marinicellulosiphila megalodicopiae TaxID=2724896 RepID=UPI003BB1A2DD
MKLRQLNKAKNSKQTNIQNSKRNESLPLMVKRHALNSALLASLKQPVLILGAAASMMSGVAIAGPSGGVVTNGGATITQSQNHTQINQSTNKAVVQWDSFNVGANESVQFIQPSSGSVILNQINDQNPSQIFGQIDANGTVFLTNQHGVVFGETAQVNVANIVATSMNVNANDFMQGDYNLEHTAESKGLGGMVVNHGLINAASGGSVNLVADGVDNQGVIIANYGSVNLASGEKVVVDFDGSNLIKFEVSGEVLQNSIATIDEHGEVQKGTAINNSGTISTQGGQVLLQGNVAQDIFDRSVNNDGVISAGRMENIGGVIHLSGIGIVENSGAVNVDGLTATDTGGQVQILGDTVLITESATIDASGAVGGGEILIGGDFQGSNSEIKNATNTYVSSDSVISADATQSGNGGKVIVWADQTTIYDGDISAQGGSESGDGGFVEVSGKQNLAFYGGVSTDAVNGKKGELLLDPDTIAIEHNVIGGGDPLDPNDDVDIAEIILSYGDSDFTISDAKINDLLLSSSVSFAATTSITVGDSLGAEVVVNGGVDNDFTLISNQINIENSKINLSGTGSVNLQTSAGGTDAGTINLGAGTNITTANGSINIHKNGSLSGDGSTTESFTETGNTTVNIASTVALTSSGTGEINLGNVRFANATDQLTLSGNTTGEITADSFGNDSTEGVLKLLTNADVNGAINIGKLEVDHASGLTTNSTITAGATYLNGNLTSTNGALNLGAVDLQADLTISSNSTITTGAVTLDKDLTLSSSNNILGDMTVSGSNTLTSGTGTLSANKIDLDNGATLTIDSTQSGKITVTNGINKTGDGSDGNKETLLIESSSRASALEIDALINVDTLTVADDQGVNLTGNKTITSGVTNLSGDYTATGTSTLGDVTVNSSLTLNNNTHALNTNKIDLTNNTTLIISNSHSGAITATQGINKASSGNGTETLTIQNNSNVSNALSITGAINVETFNQNEESGVTGLTSVTANATSLSGNLTATGGLSLGALTVNAASVIDSGSTLTATTATLNQNLTLKDDITFTGLVRVAGNSTLSAGGNTIKANGITINDDVTLTIDSSQTGEVTVTNGIKKTTTNTGTNKGALSITSNDTLSIVGNIDVGSLTVDDGDGDTTIDGINVTSSVTAGSTTLKGKIVAGGAANLGVVSVTDNSLLDTGTNAILATSIAITDAKELTIGANQTGEITSGSIKNTTVSNGTGILTIQNNSVTSNQNALKINSSISVGTLNQNNTKGLKVTGTNNTVSATNTNLTGNLTTSGSQNLGAVGLNADVTLDSTGTDITLGAVDANGTGTTARDLTVDAGADGVVTLGAITDADVVTVTGKSLTLNGSVTSSGAQDYSASGDVTIGSTVTLTTSDDAVSLGSLNLGGHSLSIQSGTGLIDFTGAVGTTESGQSLTLNNFTEITSISGNLTFGSFTGSRTDKTSDAEKFIVNDTLKFNYGFGTLTFEENLAFNNNSYLTVVNEGNDITFNGYIIIDVDDDNGNLDLTTGSGLMSFNNLIGVGDGNNENPLMFTKLNGLTVTTAYTNAGNGNQIYDLIIPDSVLSTDLNISFSTKFVEIGTTKTSRIVTSGLSDNSQDLELRNVSFAADNIEIGGDVTNLNSFELNGTSSVKNVTTVSSQKYTGITTVYGDLAITGATQTVTDGGGLNAENLEFLHIKTQADADSGFFSNKNVGDQVASISNVNVTNSVDGNVINIGSLNTVNNNNIYQQVVINAIDSEGVASGSIAIGNALVGKLTLTADSAYLGKTGVISTRGDQNYAAVDTTYLQGTTYTIDSDAEGDDAFIANNIVVTDGVKATFNVGTKVNEQVTTKGKYTATITGEISGEFKSTSNTDESANSDESITFDTNGEAIVLTSTNFDENSLDTVNSLKNGDKEKLSTITINGMVGSGVSTIVDSETVNELNFSSGVLSSNLGLTYLGGDITFAGTTFNAVNSNNLTLDTNSGTATGKITFDNQLVNANIGEINLNGLDVTFNVDGVDDGNVDNDGDLVFVTTTIDNNLNVEFSGQDVSFISALQIKDGKTLSVSSDQAVNFASVTGDATTNAKESLNVTSTGGAITFTGEVSNLDTVSIDAGFNKVTFGNLVSSITNFDVNGINIEETNNQIDIDSTSLTADQDLNLAYLTGGGSSKTINLNGLLNDSSVDINLTADTIDIDSETATLNTLTLDATSANIKSVTTTYDQDYSKVTTLTTLTTNGTAPLTTLSSTSGNISAGSISAAGQDLQLTANTTNGIITIGNIGSDADLNSLTVTANSLFLGDVNTSGAQDYSAVNTLTLNGSLNSSSTGDITFSSTTDDKIIIAEATTASITNSDGGISLNNVEGVDGNDAESLTLSAGASNISINNLNYSSTGLSTIIINDITADLDASGNLIFRDKVNEEANQVLTVSNLNLTYNNHNITFEENVLIAEDGNLTVSTGENSAGNITFSGDISEKATNYDDVIDNEATPVYGAEDEIVSIQTGSGTINLGGAINGIEDLTLNGLSGSADGGDITFSDTNNSDLYNDTIVIDNTLNLNSAGQNFIFENDVALAEGVTLSLNSVLSGGVTDGDIQFKGSVLSLSEVSELDSIVDTSDGSGAGAGTEHLNLTAGTGSVYFKDGDFTLQPTDTYQSVSLDSLTVSGASAELGQVTTTGAQDYSAVNLLALNNSLEVSAAGDITIGDGAGTEKVTVNTTGHSITANNGNITIHSELQGSAGTESLEITANDADGVLSNIALNDAVSNLVSFTLDADSATLNSVTTTGAQDYSAVTQTTLNGDLHSTTSGSITFGREASTAPVLSAVAGNVVVDENISITTQSGAVNVLGTVTGNGDNETLSIIAKGNAIEIDGTVSSLGGLTLTGNTASLNSVSTSGAQNYSGVGTTTLNGDLTATSGDITFGREAGTNITKVDGNVKIAETGNDTDVSINSAAGAIVINGTLQGSLAANNTESVLLTSTNTTVKGEVTKLESLTTSGGNVSLNTVTTSGLQNYSGIATLNGALSGSSLSFAEINLLTNEALSATGTSITITGGVTGNGNTFDVDANTFVSITGAVEDISSIDVDAKTTAILGAITSTGSQDYSGVGTTTLTGDLTATSGDITFGREAGTNITKVDGNVKIAETTKTTDVSINSAAGAIVINGTLQGSLAANNTESVLLTSTNTTVKGEVTKLESLTTSGGNVSLNTVTTSGLQNYSGIATLNGALSGSSLSFAEINLLTNEALSATGTSIIITGGVTGNGNTFDVDANTFVSITGAVEDISSIDVDAKTTATLGAITSAGSQDYSGVGTTTLNGDLTATSGDITFGREAGANITKVDGNVKIAETGNDTDVSINSAAGAIVINGTLQGSLAANNTESVLLTSTNTTVKGEVTKLESLTTSGGNVSLNTVTTSGLQNYSGIATLNGALSGSSLSFAEINLLTNEALSATGTSITITGGVTGNGNTFDVDANTFVSITGAVEDISSIDVDAKTTAILGAITSTGSQDYSGVGTTTLTGDLTATSGDITFGREAGTNITKVDGNVKIAETTKTTDVSINSAAGAIVINGTLQGSLAANNTESVLLTSTNTTVKGEVTKLESLTTSGDNVSLNTVTTSGLQNYSGIATLNGALSGSSLSFAEINLLTNEALSATGTSIIITGGVTGNGNTFDVDANTFVSITGEVTNVNTVDIDAGTTAAIGSVTSTGEQNYLDVIGITTVNGNLTAGSAINLNKLTIGSPANGASANLVLDATGGSGNISINSVVGSAGDTLTLQAGSGTISFKDANGGVTGVDTLAIQGTVTSDFNNDFTTVNVIGSATFNSSNNLSFTNVNLDANESLILGQTNNTQNIQIETLNAANDSDSLTLHGQYIGTGDLGGVGTISLGQASSIITKNEAISINNLELLTNSDALIQINPADNDQTTAESITISGTVTGQDTTNNNAEHLTLTALGGSVKIDKAVDKLESLTITANTIGLTSVNTTGDQTYSDGLEGGSKSTTTVSTELISTSGNIKLENLKVGDTSSGTDVVIQTSLSLISDYTGGSNEGDDGYVKPELRELILDPAGDILIDGTITGLATLVPNPNASGTNLTIKSSGDVTVSEDIININELIIASGGRLKINNTDNVNDVSIIADQFFIDQSTELSPGKINSTNIIIGNEYNDELIEITSSTVDIDGNQKLEIIGNIEIMDGTDVLFGDNTGTNKNTNISIIGTLAGKDGGDDESITFVAGLGDVVIKNKDGQALTAINNIENINVISANSFETIAIDNAKNVVIESDSVDLQTVTATGEINLTKVTNTILNGDLSAANINLNTIDGAGALSLTTTATGAVNIDGNVINLDSLTISANTASLKSVTTTGNQDYSDVTTTTLNGDLSASNGNVTFNELSIAGESSITASDASNTESNDIGLISFNGSVGSGTGTQSLEVTAQEEIRANDLSGVDLILNSNLTAVNGDLTLGKTTVKKSVTISAGTNALNIGDTDIQGSNTLTLGKSSKTTVSGVVTTTDGLGDAGTGNLVINSTGSVDFEAAVAVNDLTVTNSGGVEFSKSVTANDVVVNATNDAKSIAFLNGLTATSFATNLTSEYENFSIVFGDGTNIINATTLTNTGGVTINGTANFINGLTHITGNTEIAGTLQSGSQNITLGTVTLAGPSSISASESGKQITIAGVNAHLGDVTDSHELTLTASQINSSSDIVVGGDLTVSGNLDFATATADNVDNIVSKTGKLSLGNIINAEHLMISANNGVSLSGNANLSSTDLTIENVNEDIVIGTSISSSYIDIKNEKGRLIINDDVQIIANQNASDLADKEIIRQVKINEGGEEFDEVLFSEYYFTEITENDGESRINIEATDLDLNGVIRADFVTLTATNENKLIFQSHNLYGATVSETDGVYSVNAPLNDDAIDDAFKFTFSEFDKINSFTSNQNINLHLKADDLVYVAGDFASLSDSKALDLNLFLNISDLDNDNDGGQVFIGSTVESIYYIEDDVMKTDAAVTGTEYQSSVLGENNIVLNSSFDHLFKYKQGDLIVDNLHVGYSGEDFLKLNPNTEKTISETYVIGNVTTDNDLSLNSDKQYLSQSPFVNGVTSVESKLVANGSLSFNTTEAVIIENDLTLQSKNDLNLSQFNIIGDVTKPSKDKNVIIIAGGDVTLGKVGGSEINEAVTSLRVIITTDDIHTDDNKNILDEGKILKAATSGDVILTQDIYTSGAVNFDKTTSLKVRESDVSINAQNVIINELNTVNSLNVNSDSVEYNELNVNANKFTVNADLNFNNIGSDLNLKVNEFDLDGKFTTLNIGSTSIEGELFQIEGDFEANALKANLKFDSDTTIIKGNVNASDLLTLDFSTTNLIINGGIKIPAATSVNVNSENIYLSGNFAATSAVMSFNNDIVLMNDVTFNVNKLNLPSNIKDINLIDDTEFKNIVDDQFIVSNESIDLDLINVGVIGLSSTTEINLDQGDIRFNSATDQFNNSNVEVNENAQNNLKLSTNGSVTLGENIGFAGEIKSLSVESSKLNLFGNISTSSSLTLSADEIINGQNIALTLDSSRLSLGGKFITDSDIGSYDLTLSENVNAYSDLDLSDVKVSSLSNSGLKFNSAYIWVDESGETQKNTNTIILGNVSADYLTFEGVYTFDGDITSTGSKGMSFNSINGELSSDVTFKSYESSTGVGGDVLLSNSLINTYEYDLTIIGKSVTMNESYKDGSVIQSGGGNIEVNALNGDIKLTEIDNPYGNVVLNSSGTVIASDTVFTGNTINDSIVVTGEKLTINSSGVGVSASNPLVVSIENGITLNVDAPIAYIDNLTQTNIVSSPGLTVIDPRKDRIETTDTANTLSTISFDQADDEDSVDSKDSSKVYAPGVNSNDMDIDGNYTIASLVPTVPTLIKTDGGWIFSHGQFNVQDDDEEDEVETHIRKRKKKEGNSQKVEWFLENPLSSL